MDLCTGGFPRPGLQGSVDFCAASALPHLPARQAPACCLYRSCTAWSSVRSGRRQGRGLSLGWALRRSGSSWPCWAHHCGHTWACRGSVHRRGSHHPSCTHQLWAWWLAPVYQLSSAPLWVCTDHQRAAPALSVCHLVVSAHHSCQPVVRLSGRLGFYIYRYLRFKE